MTSAVAVLGDSNVLLYETGVRRNLDGYDITVAAKPGVALRGFTDSTTLRGCIGDYWPDVIKDLPPVEAIVVQLGINDAAARGTESTPGYGNFGPKIDWFMELIPGGVPVLWSNLPCDLEPLAWRTGCVAINDALVVAADRWPDLTVIDWAAAATGRPEFIEPDDIHLTFAGATAWIGLVRATLQASETS